MLIVRGRYSINFITIKTQENNFISNLLNCACTHHFPAE